MNTSRVLVSAMVVGAIAGAFLLGRESGLASQSLSPHAVSALAEDQTPPRPRFDPPPVNPVLEGVVPIDRSLVGAAPPRAPLAVTPAVPPDTLAPSSLAGLDPRVIPVYEGIVKALGKMEASIEEGAHATPRRSLTVLRYRAYAKLIRELRVFYCGEAANCPRPRQTANTKYASINTNGLALVLEIHRAEFPDLFDVDDHPEKYAAGRNPIDTKALGK